MSTNIYHITHINNLTSILNSGGLLANSQLRQQQTKYLDIAHGHIQDRRSTTPVPCSAGGYLHDYVPFYFAPRSPMLYAIHKQNVEGYSGGQQLIIHLVSEVELIADSGTIFAFTDGHAIMAYSDFYNEISALEYVIDWELMASKYWFNTPEDPNRKCRRQAEFLLYEFCPWNLITEVGVINSKVAQQVRQIFKNFNIQTPVNIYSPWYY
ncbi:hypothetical protein NIES37_73280 (plasmid) [Tolypothrix tenuis PCC 7101]|uniref:DarT domain-containing protein n=1 Tax=Tolypothrix tenuis PCC 7101 TaxID=231146 RepID=A0A1Z4NC96_9CYAN|nr:DUF4433 domain-containing protein [Aulosira sp. FACHB-113]BAZ03315.1 hypothetical protein NIES37_73280 [Tolypothrix tenuis PCC 7101]BAZ78714.1 hypothetical protein NIES50_73470 [Aulosira laxa NIES-50]